MRKQLFHQQQQQLQQQQQFNLDMKSVMSLVAENNINNYRVPYISQARQEMFNMCPNNIEEQGYFMLNGNSSVPEASVEDILWDGLWNLDDVHGNFSVANATNKNGLYNLVSPYC